MDICYTNRNRMRIGLFLDIFRLHDMVVKLTTLKEQICQDYIPIL